MHLELVPAWVTSKREICVFAYSGPGGKAECICGVVEAGRTLGLELQECILQRTQREFEDRRKIEDMLRQGEELTMSLRAVLERMKARRPSDQMRPDAVASSENDVDTNAAI